MSNFFRRMVIIGLVAFVPALVVLWRQSMPSAEFPPVSNKMFGTSAISHGGPTTVPSVPNQSMVDHGDFEPGQTVLLRKDESTGPTEVVITKRDVRRLPDERTQDLYEVRFADGTTSWVPRQALPVSSAVNE